MISKYTHQNLTWVDLESPTPEEISALIEEYNLNPLIASELENPTLRAKIDPYPKSVFLVLHFPTRNRTTGHIQETEVDFVLLPNLLITTHYEFIDPLHDFAKAFELGDYLSQQRTDFHEGTLFYFALRELYKHTLFILETVEHEVHEIEKQIFKGKEAKMVAELSRVNRSVIDIRQSLRYHKDTLAVFARSSKEFYTTSFDFFASSIQSEYEKIEQTVTENRQTLRDLRETNDSLLSAKTNAIMKRLTMVSVIILPLTFIANIFTMNSKYLTIDKLWQVQATFGAMIFIAIFSIIYFSYRKWL